MFHPASTSRGKFWPSSLLNGTLSRDVLLALYNALARTSPSHFGNCRLSWLAGEHCKVANESEAAGKELKVDTEVATLSEHTVFTFLAA